MRWRRVAVAAAVVVAATAPWWGPVALRPFGFFRVRRIAVVGARYLSPATIVGALGLAPRTSVWTDTRALERRVDHLAGVQSARVTRRLPGELVVTVDEVEPVALAQGPAGLVPVDDSARPLPYDPAAVPVDAPIVERADPVLVEALATIRATDLGLFADITAARTAGRGGKGDVVLDLVEGRVRLTAPLDPAVVRAVSAVRLDLDARHEAWRELDGRFRGWVVVRRPEPARDGSRRAGTA